jgi:hypothetical protein
MGNIKDQFLYALYALGFLAKPGFLAYLLWPEL